MELTDNHLRWRNDFMESIASSKIKGKVTSSLLDGLTRFNLTFIALKSIFALSPDGNSLSDARCT